MPARNQATSGLADEMSPGDVSDLSLSGDLAFRARFDGELPPPKERYWRGPVLHDFDGRTWRRSSRVLLEQPATTTGPVYRYRLTLEPHQRRWVFGLDMPTEWPRRLEQTFDYQLQVRRDSDPISVVTAFDLVSQTAFEVGGPLPLTTRKANTALPIERNPRALALARQMRDASGSDEAFIEAILNKFRNEEYFYTLEPPRLEIDSVDDFLFNTRRGFCEHFASAFTVLVRAAGIPARVVTGYQGGEYNAIGGYLIVRQSEAHAWSEVWLDDRGWLRIDPTAAVAPERIEQSLDAAMSEDEPVPGRLLRSGPLSQLRLLWDTANAFWNDQVVEFGETQQRWLLGLFDIDEPEWKTLALALAISLGVFFAGLSAYLAWRFRPRRRDPLVQVYEQLCRKLARRDLVRLRHEGPRDYLTRAAVARPDLASRLEEVRSLYISLRYGPTPLAAQLSRLKFLVNEMRA